MHTEGILVVIIYTQILLSTSSIEIWEESWENLAKTMFNRYYFRNIYSSFQIPLEEIWDLLSPPYLQILSPEVIYLVPITPKLLIHCSIYSYDSRNASSHLERLLGEIWDLLSLLYQKTPHFAAAQIGK